jgi:iron uptake system component EfeO
VNPLAPANRRENPPKCRAEGDFASARPWGKAGIAAVAALLAGISLTSCTAKEPAATDGAKDAPGHITVNASDTECELSGTEANTGPSTFVITNNGSKVTEFYVYGEGERVMGEVENISPGLERKLIVQLGEPGKYQTACKPGMIGDGLRSDFTVTGDAVKIDTEGKFKEASDSYKRYVSSQTDALIAATQVFVDAVKKGDVPAAKAQYPIARTYYERIEPVAESFPDDLDPRIDLREADLEPGQKWTGFHRLEKDLWATGLQPDSTAMADQLLADVKELDTGVKAPDYRIDSTQIAGGAQGLLDEIASSKISGEEDIFSHTDLWDFQANVDGSQTAVSSVRPILDERNAELGKRVDQRFTDVEALLAKYRQGDGFVLYDKVTEPQRQELSRAIDALGKEVSQVQGVIAPR